MRNYSLTKIILASVLFLPLVCVAIEPYEFPSEEARQRFQDLTFELRCPKCQNQNIADSNAPIAQDLRKEVHRMLLEGDENDEIVDFMVERYGDFVVYRPPFSVRTFALWTLPVILVLVGIATAIWLGRRSRMRDGDNEEMNKAEQQRLQQLLKEASEQNPI